MSHEKTCQDYALMKIGRGSKLVDGRWVSFVEHDGRTVFQGSDYETAMFAAELYARLEQLSKRRLT